MAVPLKINDDFKRFCQQLEFDANLKDYKDKLIDWKNLENLHVLNNQFFFIYDFTICQNVFVHNNAEEITGYPIRDFRDFGFDFLLIHPDDRELVYEFSKHTLSITRDCRTELLKDPSFIVFSVDFRLKCKNGCFIRLSRQNCCFRADNKGNMVYALLYFTDISHLKKSDNVPFSWIGDINHKMYFDDLIEKYQGKNKITKREKVVLSMLAEGESATQIASRLSVSVHTIISHRRNLLHKTGSRNTAQLIKVAVEKHFL